MTLVELYTKDGCPLCDDAHAVLEKVRAEIPFTLKVVTLLPGEQNYDEFKEDFPVIHINKRFAFKHRVNEHMVKIRIQQVENEAQPRALEDDPDVGRTADA